MLVLSTVNDQLECIWVLFYFRFFYFIFTHFCSGLLRNRTINYFPSINNNHYSDNSLHFSNRINYSNSTLAVLSTNHSIIFH